MLSQARPHREELETFYFCHSCWEYVNVTNEMCDKCKDGFVEESSRPRSQVPPPQPAAPTRQPLEARPQMYINPQTGSGSRLLQVPSFVSHILSYPLWRIFVFLFVSAQVPLDPSIFKLGSIPPDISAHRKILLFTI